jgi:mRNA interferase MazF
VLVLQANAFNDSSISTVIVAVITSNLALADAPGNVRLSASASGLAKPSVVNVSQVMTIDRSALSGRVSVLSSTAIAKIEGGLRLVLAL